MVHSMYGTRHVWYTSMYGMVHCMIHSRTSTPHQCTFNSAPLHTHISSIHLLNLRAEPSLAYAAPSNPLVLLYDVHFPFHLHPSFLLLETSPNIGGGWDKRAVTKLSFAHVTTIFRWVWLFQKNCCKKKWPAKGKIPFLTF